MKLNMKELLTGDINRLSEVQRFSTFYTIRKESVAEHSFTVALYCIFIHEWLKENVTPYIMDNLPLDRLLLKALLHDLEETVTGDVIRAFKITSPGLKSSIELAGDLAFCSAVRPVTDSTEFTELLTYTRSTGGNKHTNCGAVVDFADFLSAMQYLILEARMGNGTLKTERFAESLLKHCKIYRGTEFDFMRPLVNDALTVVREELFLFIGFPEGVK